jgi:hypothetical protein
MAYPKAFKEILDGIVEIDRKLDILLAGSAPAVKNVPNSFWEEAPIPNYEKATIAEVLRAAKGLNAQDTDRLLKYEQAHKNRAPVIESLTSGK